MCDYTVIVPIFTNKFDCREREVMFIQGLRELQEYLMEHPGSIFYYDGHKFLVEKDYLFCGDEK